MFYQRIVGDKNARFKREVTIFLISSANSVTRTTNNYKLQWLLF